MFNIDDVVRFIPPTYLDIFKSFNYVDNWRDAIPATDECVMIGGRYKILAMEKEENGRIFYSLIPNGVNNRGWVTEENLVLDQNVENCPYQPGDSVVLCLSDSERRRQNFPNWNKAYHFDDENHVYTITAISNKFYIFILYEKANPNSAPFRWDNFKKLD